MTFFELNAKIDRASQNCGLRIKKNPKSKIENKEGNKVVFQVCVVCITIALVWFISVLIPVVIQIKRTAKEIEVSCKSIYSLSEGAKESLVQINKTVESLSNRFKEDAEKIDNVVSKIKGVTDIITDGISSPLIKIISLVTGIGSGLRFLSQRRK